MSNKNIIALGAETKTSFSVISQNGTYTSDQLDDLLDVNIYKSFESNARGYLQKNNIIPDVIACDMHPDYRSTYLAKEFFAENKTAKLVKVQHHHAHIVSCMLDNDINEDVIGVSFDGTGYGLDANFWGGEFLVCNRKDFSRKYHLKYVAIPGSDIAIMQTWRMAISYLLDAYEGSLEAIDTPVLTRIDAKKTEVIKQMIQKNINCPLSSSMGRLFDAVSSLVGICDIASFEAEGAIKLEQVAAKDVLGSYPYEIIDDVVDLSSMIKKTVKDINDDLDVSIISALFHNTIGEIIFDVSKRISNETNIKKVLVSGGCFLNKYLVNYIEKRFKDSGLELYKHNNVPTTDLGVSLGQAVVAGTKV